MAKQRESIGARTSKFFGNPDSQKSQSPRVSKEKGTLATQKQQIRKMTFDLPVSVAEHFDRTFHRLRYEEVGSPSTRRLTKQQLAAHVLGRVDADEVRKELEA